MKMNEDFGMPRTFFLLAALRIRHDVKSIYSAGVWMFLYYIAYVTYQKVNLVKRLSMAGISLSFYCEYKSLTVC